MNAATSRAAALAARLTALTGDTARIVRNAGATRVEVDLSADVPGATWDGILAALAASIDTRTNVECYGSHHHHGIITVWAEICDERRP